MKIYRTQGDGRWFPGGARQLKTMVESYLAAADGSVCADGVPIASAISPHAGYVYSGAVAGYAGRALQEAHQGGNGPDLVVVLGFPHRAAFSGLAWLDADIIRTPAGDIPVDRDFMECVQKSLTGVFWDTEFHAGEHSAENQLPFIQMALPGVPVAVGLVGGHADGLPVTLAGALQEAAGDRRVCVLASTDLLHDADYDRVIASDTSTLEMMEKLDLEGLDKAWSYTTQICCGIGPVLTALEFARLCGCPRGRRLFYCNSGDIDPAGRGQWVVGYGAMVFECGATGKRKA